MLRSSSDQPTLPLSGRQGGWGGGAENSWRPVHSRGLLGLQVFPYPGTVMKLSFGLQVNSQSFARYSHITIALISVLLSGGALAFGLPSAAKDGWKLVGINAKSRIFWIRPASIAGEFNDRTVDLLEFEPPGPFSRQTTLHIDCTQGSTWLSRGGLRTSQILLISPNSVWDSISRILCSKHV